MNRSEWVRINLRLTLVQPLGLKPLETTSGAHHGTEKIPFNTTSWQSLSIFDRDHHNSVAPSLSRAIKKQTTVAINLAINLFPDLAARVQFVTHKMQGNKPTVQQGLSHSVLVSHSKRLRHFAATPSLLSQPPRARICCGWGVSFWVTDITFFWSLLPHRMGGAPFQQLLSYFFAVDFQMFYISLHHQCFGSLSPASKPYFFLALSIQPTLFLLCFIFL